MRIRKSKNDSFDAWGIGLFYEFDSDSKYLSITHARNYEPIIDIPILFEYEWALKYIKIIERTTQIQALMLSNNTTLDIAEILSPQQLKSYLEGTLSVASKALALKEEAFDRFGTLFCDRYDLKSLIIEKKVYGRHQTVAFEAVIESHKGNVISSKAYFLHNCLFNLSRAVISDLIFKETGHNFDPEAHRLLRASSKLSVLSLLFNRSFVARRKLIRPMQSKESETQVIEH